MTKLTIEQQDMVMENQGLIGMILKRYMWGATEQDKEDLRQEGNIGLCLAAQRFDPSKGFKFSTFASKCIYGTMTRYYQNQILCPVHLTKSERKQFLNKDIEIICSSMDIELDDCTVGDLYLVDESAEFEEGIIEHIFFDQCASVSKYTKRQQEIIKTYLATNSEPLSVKMLGISRQRINQVINEFKKDVEAKIKQVNSI